MSSNDSAPSSAGGEGAAPPQELLSCLWDMYCASLVDCHYDHDAVAQVWEAFGAVLSDACPLQLPAQLVHAAAPTDGDDGICGLSTTPAVDAVAMAKAGLLMFDVPWHRLDAAQQQAIVDVPLTLLPMLEFLRAVVAWRAATSVSPSPSGQHVDVRVTRLQVVVRGGPQTPFRALGAGVINQLVFVQGTIIRLSTPKVVCARMPFRCVLCGAMRVVDVEGGPLVFPSVCAGKCRGYFVPMPEMAETEEVQLVKLQEMVQLDAAAPPVQGTAQGPQGDQAMSPMQQQGMHRVMEVELRGVWIDVATAGDIIAVGGVGCTRRGDRQSGVGMRHLSLKVVSLTSLGNGSTRLGGGGRSRSDAAALVNKHYTYDKVAQFFELAKHPNWFDRLVASIAPGIMGLTDVKAAMLLALAGGTVKAHARSNIHVLMVGDPGLGKSQLLRAVCAVAPRSSMATANTSSSCGLTITLSRDPQNGETTFEAGAVVHGDGGVTCIDEIDKGATEHKALLEVMEQGTISIAKAGTLFSMHVDTSVLAAGNPVGGKFQSGKGLSENINISAPLLSRFDVIFLLQSLVQGSTTSQHITTHVLDMHRAETAASKDAHGSRRGQAALLPPALMTEFLQYARDTCRPVMTAAAASVLRDAYLDARKIFATNTTQLPVTPRYLQSLIRISEAKAKLDLRREVSEVDAKYAVLLLVNGAKSYMEGGACNNNTNSSGGGGGGSKKLSQRDMVLGNMQRLLAANGVDTLSHDEAIGCCADAGCKNPNLMLQQLNEFGAVLMTAGKYRLRRKL